MGEKDFLLVKKFALTGGALMSVQACAAFAASCFLVPPFVCGAFFLALYPIVSL